MTEGHLRAPVMELRDVAKSYGGARALRGGNLTLMPGSIHGLVGPNGAGKSTLIKAATGVISPDAGTITIDGEPVRYRSPGGALSLGVASMPQELTVVESMTVADNVVLGSEVTAAGMLRPGRRDEIVRALLARVGLDVAPKAPLGDLSPAEQRAVMLARLLHKGARVLFLDEPTAALSESQASVLMDAIERLRDEGLTIVYVSHRFSEVERLCSDVTVLRDGETVDVLSGDRLTASELVKAVVVKGGEASSAKRKRVAVGEVVLAAKSLTGRQLRGVDLQLRRGEVVGVCGLPDAGASELLAIIGGDVRARSGRIDIGGSSRQFGSPADALKVGVAYLPPERNRAGLMASSLDENVLMASLRSVWKFGLLNRRMEGTAARPWLTPFGLDARGRSPLSSLSGGNRQKVLLARCMRAHDDVIVLDDPTMGVDINARRDIHAQIGSIADDGSGILVSSSEPEELVAIADRIVVLVRGVVADVFEGASMTPEAIISAVTVHTKKSTREEVL